MLYAALSAALICKSIVGLQWVVWRLLLVGCGVNERELLPCGGGAGQQHGCGRKQTSCDTRAPLYRHEAILPIQAVQEAAKLAASGLPAQQNRPTAQPERSHIPIPRACDHFASQTSRHRLAGSLTGSTTRCPANRALEQSRSLPGSAQRAFRCHLTSGSTIRQVLTNGYGPEGLGEGGPSGRHAASRPPPGRLGTHPSAPVSDLDPMRCSCTRCWLPIACFGVAAVSWPVPVQTLPLSPAHASSAGLSAPARRLQGESRSQGGGGLLIGHGQHAAWRAPGAAAA